MFSKTKKQEGIVLLKEVIEGMNWMSRSFVLTRPLQAEKGITFNATEAYAHMEGIEVRL